MDNLQNEQQEQNQLENQNYYQDYTASFTNEPPRSNVQSGKAKNNSASAVVSLVMGILSIVAGCCGLFGLIPGIIGLICAIVSKRKEQSGVATAGLICSIIGIVFSAIVLILSFAAVASLTPEMINSILAEGSY